MHEFELKFEIPASSLKRVLAAVHAAKPQLQNLRAFYFDTADGALANNGLVLRMRKEGDDWVQTAKAASSNVLDRLEHNVNIKNDSFKFSAKSGAKASIVPSIDLSRHDNELVGKKIASAIKLSRNSAKPILIAQYETDVQRLTFLVTHLGSVIEVALDQGLVVNGARSAELCELEIELKEGKPEHAVALARIWRTKYDLWLSNITKSMKGHRLQDAHLRSLKNQSLKNQNSPVTNQTNPYLFAIAPIYKRQANAPQIVKAVMQSCLNQVISNASEIADNNYHEIHVHQLRVGIRRLRTAIDTLNGLASAVDPAWEDALIKVFRALGKQRDQDHFAQHVQPQLLIAGGPNLKTSHNSKALPNLGSVIRSAMFQDTILCIIAYVNTLDSDEKRSKKKRLQQHQNAKKILAERLDQLYLTSIKDGKKFIKLNEKQQHSVRKHFKKCRYLSEFSASLFLKPLSLGQSSQGTNSFIEQLKPVQDALGFYNDELIALQAYRKLAKTNNEAWFGVGWLCARHLPNAKTCQQALNIFIKKSKKSKLFWL